MSSLRQDQSIFALNVAKLIIFAYENGYEISFGEALRPNDMQLLYFFGYKIKVEDGELSLEKAPRKSKTLNSYHKKKLAIDINLFKDGKYLTSKKAHEPLALYWKSLHPKNNSGYFWNYDYNHYEMRR